MQGQAAGHRRLDVVLLAQAQEFRPHEARVAGPAGEADDHHHEVEAAPEEGDEGEQQEQCRHRLEDLDQAHAGEVHRAGEPSHQSAHHDADEHRDAGGDEPDSERDARGVDHPREDVRAVLVGAEPVGAVVWHRERGLEAGIARVALVVLRRPGHRCVNRPLDLAVADRLAVLLVDGEDGWVGQRGTEQGGARQCRQHRDHTDAQAASNDKQRRGREEYAHQDHVRGREVHEGRALQPAARAHEQGMGIGEKRGEGRDHDQRPDPHRAHPGADAHEGRPEHPRREAAPAQASPVCRRHCRRAGHSRLRRSAAGNPPPARPRRRRLARSVAAAIVAPVIRSSLSGPPPRSTNRRRDSR